jgi:hypothetical protein
MAAPEIHTTESASAVTVTVTMTGTASKSDIREASRALLNALYEFNEKLYRADPPRLKLMFGNVFMETSCAITGYVFEAGGIEYVLDQEDKPAVSPEFVRDIDPALYEAGQIIGKAFDCLHSDSEAGNRLLEELDTIIKGELYRTMPPEALTARLQPLLANVPPLPEPLTYAPDDDDVPFLTDFEDQGADIPFGPRRVNPDLFKD